MAKVLTMKPGSIVTCGHGPGEVQTSSSAKLTVNKNPVLLVESIDNQSINACSTIMENDEAPPNAAKSSPCNKVIGVTGGQASKLTVGNKNVILDTLTGNTNGMVDHVIPQNHLGGKAMQSKLTAK
jgi:hypothetical protein